MAEITRAEFVRALEGFDPYTDYQIEPEDRNRLGASFDAMDVDRDGVVTEAEALTYEPTTPREALSLVHFREALRLTARSPSTELEGRMDRLDRMLLAQMVTQAQGEPRSWDQLLHQTWLSTLSIPELDALPPGQTYRPEDVPALEAELQRLTEGLRGAEPMATGDASAIGIILRQASIPNGHPQGLAALARHEDRYTPLVEGLTPESLGEVAAAVGDETRQVLIGEDHNSGGAATVTRALLEQLASEGRAPDALVIEAERRLNSDEFREVMERYAGRELSPNEEGEFRRELRLALDIYDGNRRTGYEHNLMDVFGAPTFPGRIPSGSYITGTFELEAPTRQWQSYEDLFVSAARHGTEVRFIDQSDPNDGVPRDAIMADEIAALRHDIGDDALILGAFGWWHVQEVRNHGSGERSDIDDQPLGFRLAGHETLSVAVTRWNGSEPQGVDFVFHARDHDFRNVFGND